MATSTRPNQKMTTLSFYGPSNFQRSRAFSSEYSLNWYPFFDSESKRWAMYPFAGSNKLFDFDVGSAPYTGRAGGAIATEQDAFFIVGDLLYRVDTAFAPHFIDNIMTNTGSLSMDLGGEYLVITDGAAGYTYDIQSGVFGPITSGQAPLNPTSVCEQQSYFLLNSNGTQSLQQSASYDPTTWDAINGIEINYRSSYLSFPLIAQYSINGRIFCFTTGFIEVLENEGKTGFTFRPDENLIFGYGAVNASCIAKGTGGMTGEEEPEFLIFICKNPDGNKKVMMTTGTAPEIISTPSVDYRINSLVNINDAVAYVSSYNGQTFYVCSFKDDNLTIVYNLNTKMWSDISWNGGRHFSEAFCFFNGKRLVTSYLDAGLYEMSEDLITDFGGLPIRHQRVTRNFRLPGFVQMTGDLIMLWFEQGVGLPGQVVPGNPHYVYGADPLVYVEVSYDGGVSFSAPQLASIGRVGERYFTGRITNLGNERDFTFRFTISDPVRCYFLGAEFYYTPAEGTQ